MTNKISILFVDDEENNLISFNAYFRREFEVYTATSAASALKIIEKVPLDIIMADQRMPATTGIEFLEKTVEKYPDTIRVLITGQSDINVVIDAINRGQVTRYLTKPWDWAALRQTIYSCGEMYRMRQKMVNQNKQLLRLNDELHRFVYSISNDLRGPLASILGLVEILKTEELPRSVSAPVELIEQSVNRVDYYVRNVLEYYQHSKAEVVKSEIDFKEMFHSLFSELKSLEPDIDFEFRINADSKFHGDEFRVKVLFSHLLANAVHFRSAVQKKPVIKAQVTMNKDLVNVVLYDNGVGLMQDHMDTLFKIFFRNSNSQNRPGRGVGLFIVKEILENLGGEIAIRSTNESEAGMEFEVVIPNKISLDADPVT